MANIKIVTDSNSGITQAEAKELGIFVVPMPFLINGEEYFEDINLTQKEFYEHLQGDAAVSTSQPSAVTVTELWDELLKDGSDVVHIPMSSGLSETCHTAQNLAKDYNGRVQVVDNQRISVTLKQSVLDALKLAEAGKSAAEIKEYLESTKFDSSIYISLDTLKYLKKGGRLTPAAALIGTILKIKPVLQIQGEKLDAFRKVHSLKQAKNEMINAIRNDLATHVYDITYGTIEPGVDNLVVIDDSIVRGTTLRQSIIKILDRLHPKKIIIVSSSPQIRYPDCYGIDMSRMGEFIAFKAAVELLKEQGKEHILQDVYRKSKAQQHLPKEQIVNYVREIYTPFTQDDISKQIARMLTPPGTRAEVELVFQTLDGLHTAIPGYPGDWYFSGNYPTPGGNHLVNNAFINFMEGADEKRSV